MKEKPPQTIRPNHPVVRALENDTFIDLMEEILIPGQWKVSKDEGFWWIPHRLRHDIDLVSWEDDSAGWERSCRSTFLLCVDAEDDEQALGMCDYLNQRSLGGAAWFDFTDRSIKFTSSVRLSPANWFAAEIFHLTVPRLVGQLERFAPHFAESVGGRVPDAVHPLHGQRADPDQFLEETLLATLQPETACGLWWSRREIEAFRRALRFQIQVGGADSVADQIDPVSYDTEVTSARNIETTVVFESPSTDIWTSLTLQEARHPEYGYGMECILDTSLLFGDDPGSEGQPVSPFEAVFAANGLNAVQHHLCDVRLSMGAWMTWRGQLIHQTFLYPEPLAVIQHLAGDHVGEVLALLVGQTMDHTRQLWKSYDNMREAFGDPTQLGEPRWDGVHSNAGMSPMFGAADELFRDMYSTYSLNHLIDPIDIGPEGFALQTAKTLATFGIFNPVGPSVGSIEVAINYRLGAALLLERLRHPHAPTTRIHAVLDQNGFNSIERLLADLVARLEWSTFDWWDTRTSLPGDVAAMRRGLRRFAEKFPASDMERLTLGLMEAVDDPWVRVAHDFRPRIQTPKGVDPIDF